MPVSTKRSARARKEVNKDVEVPDSSPSRPAKRRKKDKVEETVEEPGPDPKQEELEPLPTNRADIPMDDDKLIETVIPFLAMPPRFVQVAKDHSNDKFKEAPNQSVTAYAKLAGKDWSFYVTVVKVAIGRPPEGDPAAPSGEGSGQSASAPPKENTIHIDLGPNKVVSRSHSEIYYDSETESWILLVQGRNGVKIDNANLRRGDRHILINGEVIEIGGVEMMWVMPTPNGTLQVHDRYLQRAGLIQVVDDDKTQDGSNGSSTSGHLQMPSNGQMPIAPAPPNYRRPGTPVSARSKAPYSLGKSPGYPGGTMLMNSEDIDYSLDANGHLKPSYSYAQLISQAILQAEGEKLTLAGIYNYITDKYAYYRQQLPSGWQNSIRHNLSLNKAFAKVARETDEPGKGMKWHIVPEMRDDMARSCFRGGRGGHRGSPGTGSPAAFVARIPKDSTQKLKPSPASPGLSSFKSNDPQQTPDRGGQLSRSMEDVPGDGSPLPRHKRQQGNSFGLSDDTPGSPPTLPSSMVHEESSSLLEIRGHR
ncbi:transcription factor [Cadophora gregata f. sp. sojae]|nr:transcription factor [Cadophora gregata f. sp. sojae]